MCVKYQIIKHVTKVRHLINNVFNSGTQRKGGGHFVERGAVLVAVRPARSEGCVLQMFQIHLDCSSMSIVKPT